MKKIKWQQSFQGLPDIPKSKQWIAGELGTMEQKITLKLIQSEQINDEETAIMLELTEFYTQLYNSLESVDYSKFTKSDFQKFKDYIFYAFSYNILVSNDLTVHQLYRVVINCSIVGSKKSLTKKRFLSYPPLHIVKKIDKFNRANTPKSTIFYGAESIDTALNEIKPQIGDMVSIGVWKPTRDSGTFISYPISHNFAANGINGNSTGAMAAFLELKKNQNQILGNFLEPYFQLLGREYSKPINHHYEYLISALFSTRLLEDNNNRGTYFDIECIVYPSVGNKFLTSNIAMRRDVFKKEFELDKVVEFKITDTNYGSGQKENPESISIVEYENYRETNKFEENNIIW